MYLSDSKIFHVLLCGHFNKNKVSGSLACVFARIVCQCVCVSVSAYACERARVCVCGNMSAHLLAVYMALDVCVYVFGTSNMTVVRRPNTLSCTYWGAHAHRDTRAQLHAHTDACKTSTHTMYTGHFGFPFCYQLFLP